MNTSKILNFWGRVGGGGKNVILYPHWPRTKKFDFANIVVIWKENTKFYLFHGGKLIFLFPVHITKWDWGDWIPSKKKSHFLSHPRKKCFACKCFSLFTLSQTAFSILFVTLGQRTRENLNLNEVL